MKSLSEAIKSFSDSERQREALELLYISMSPITDDYLTDSDGVIFKLTKRKLHEVIIKIISSIKKKRNE